uniref:Coiled-coil domain-containing protein 11 n=1 Tax=Lygus hesperus TaxID=30085 RepID=A0A0A9W6V0_LYGHE
MAEVKEHQKKKKKAWRKHLDPKDKSYMDELPPEDFKLNTVTTVNPYVFADEIDEAKREKEYRKRVELAILRREMQSRANDRQEKEFIKKVNDKSGPAWYQDLSTRQMELTDDLANMLLRDMECKMIDQTQSYLRDLGVTPHLKGTIVTKALKESNCDPVKFLIIVQKAVAKIEQAEYEEDFEKFKLFNVPHSSFSVNERLLLSAAFHIHFPILTKKLTKILPPPPEPLRVKWAEKKKKKKRTYSSPYLEPQPINEMCWYEERALRDLKNKVLKQMAKQEARDRYLESLRPKKAAEQQQEAEEKDKDSENWDDWLEDEDDQRQEKPLAKKPKKLTSLEELDVVLKDDENHLIANPVSDTNLYESTKTQPEETKKEHRPQLPAILKFYDGYTDMTSIKDKKKEVEVVEEDPLDSISGPEAHISAVVKGKLIQKSSVATQTVLDPGLGSLVDHLKQEQDLRTAIALRTLSSQDQELTKKRAFVTHGYNDYREDEPSETLVNLMHDIREDLNLLRGVERYTIYRTKSVESLLTLLSDTSYLSVESYLYDSDYREGRSEEAKKFKVERKKKRMERAFISKKHTSFNVECWDEKCGLISSDEEMPMDEFKLAKKIIADLPAEEALKYAIKYLKDRGDPMAVLPAIHRIPKLIVWYDNRRLIKSAKVKEQERAELLDKSYHLWSKPFYKVTSLMTPEISIPRCVTWDWIDKVKHELGPELLPICRDGHPPTAF